MRFVVRGFVVWLLFCVGLGCWSVGVAVALPVVERSGVFGGGLVVAGVQVLDGGQQIGQQEEVLRSSPEVVQAREVSGTAYENLDAEQARRVDGEAFPRVIDEAAGGPPQLPAG